MTGFLIPVAVVVVGAVVVWVLRTGAPKVIKFFRSLDTMFETINGKPAEMDRAKREMTPAVPSLSVQLQDLKAAVSDQTEQNRRITAVEEILGDHGGRLERLESGHQDERILAAAVQGKVVDAIAEASRRTNAREGSIDEPQENP